jgi:5-methylcytosine-specific restriction endonuclease McrA
MTSRKSVSAASDLVGPRQVFVPEGFKLKILRIPDMPQSPLEEAHSIVEAGMLSPSLETIRNILEEEYKRGYRDGLRAAQTTQAQVKKRRTRPAGLNPMQRRAIYERDNGRCGICGNNVDPVDFHIDHIHPISKGGTDDPENLQCSHPHCNTRKAARIKTVVTLDAPDKLPSRPCWRPRNSTQEALSC